MVKQSTVVRDVFRTLQTTKWEFFVKNSVRPKAVPIFEKCSMIVIVFFSFSQREK